ncbi:MAG: polysaccharide biosynthesis tyrosine autokinase, partial [Gammaproteobacteria bacterium]|nr:polysaccharide biosynthesis tyrosine autokinase [Gammaproteobacteria bacterium]
ETSLTEDMKTGNIRIIDRAEVPQSAVKPRKRLNILLAMIVGLTLGTGLAFLFEYLDNTIKTPEEIKRYLDIPYLGPVPAIDMDDTQEAHETHSPELEAAHSPKSTASEAYRGIRTNILFSSADSEPQVLLVSSAGPQEGKTMTSANLAITMAQAGSRVVLIDCDLRRPKVHKVFNMSREQGMSNILVGKLEVKDAMQRAAIPNLSVIPSGPVPPNPSEILGSSRMKAMIAGLRQNFDRILIDSPPISAVTDAAVLTRSIDGAVIVIRSNDKSREMVRDSLDKLKSVGAP